MKNWVVPWKRTTGRLVCNPHFWIILFLIIVISLIYREVPVFPFPWGWFWYVEVFELRNHMHGVLFSIPLIYSAVIFWWRGFAITWLLAVLVILPRMVYVEPSWVYVAINMLYLLMPLMIVLGISIELNWRDKERKALAERESERQNYMSQIFKAQENERQRLARELHDDTTQTMLVIATRAQNLSANENIKNNPQLKEQSEWIKQTAISVADELRRLSLDLRPGILDNLGFEAALRWLANGLSQNGINANMLCKGTSRKLSAEIDINLFRIVQEALNNIRRHSKATEVFIELEYAPDYIQIAIQDNGTGFFMPAIGDLTTRGKLGLAGMQQRAHFLNGVLSVNSEPGKGTRVSIRVQV